MSKVSPTAAASMAAWIVRKFAGRDVTLSTVQVAAWSDEASTMLVQMCKIVFMIIFWFVFFEVGGCRN